MRIPSAAPRYDQREEDAVRRVLESGHTAEGDEARRLAEELGDMLERSYVEMTASGTAALHLLLSALHVGPDDEVILPSYTCLSVLLPVLQRGAEPVLADVDPNTFSLSVDTVEPHLSSKTRAIVLVHNFGFPVQDEALFNLEVPVVEDVAHALGASDSDGPAGSRGRAAIGSLYATKQVAAGYGGFVATGDESLIRDIRDLKQYDHRDSLRVAFNYSLSDLLAAVGRIQLDKLPRHQARRRDLAHRFTEYLRDCEDVRPPRIVTGHALYRYVIRTSRARALEEWMQEDGIEVKRPVYRPLHRYLDDADCPTSERLHEESLLIPNHPGLSEEDADAILNRLRTFFETR